MWSRAPNEMIHWWHVDTHRYSKFMPWKTLISAKIQIVDLYTCVLVCVDTDMHICIAGITACIYWLHIYIIDSLAGRKDTTGHWADINCNSPSVERTHPRAVHGVDRPFHFVHHPILYRTDFFFFFHNGTVWLSSHCNTRLETTRATTRC